MNEDLIKRIDEEIDLLRRAVVPAFRGQIELLRDCRAEIEALSTINLQLRDHNESLDDECAQLVALADNDLNADELAARFLGWKLPEDFAPDYGIRFVRNEFHDLHGMPTGTNLFHFGQAKAMFEYVLAATEPEVTP